MFVYSRGKGRHIYHTEQCPYAKRITPDHLGYFQTRNEAEGNGYYGGICCSKLGKLLKKEKKQIREFCQKVNYTCYFKKGRLFIQTPLERWMLIHTVVKDKILIYHQNHSIKVEKKSAMKGYHIQKWRFISIYDTLLSIYDHNEAYLKKTGIPGYVKQKAYESMGYNFHAQVSRKKQGKHKRRIKAVKQKYEIKHVLDLIESLSDNRTEGKRKEES